MEIKDKIILSDINKEILKNVYYDLVNEYTKKRKEKNIKCSDIARSFGISRQAVSAFEKKATISYKMLFIYAAIFGGFEDGKEK